MAIFAVSRIQAAWPAEEVTGKPHTTIFQARTQDDFKLDDSSNLTVKAILKKLVPPILIDVRDALKNK